MCFPQEQDEDVPLVKKEISKTSSKDGPQDTVSDPAAKRAALKKSEQPSAPVKESKTAVVDDSEENLDLACVETIPGSPVMSPDESGTKDSSVAAPVASPAKDASNTAKDATDQSICASSVTSVGGGGGSSNCNKRSEMPFASAPLSMAGPADPPPSEMDKPGGDKKADGGGEGTTLTSADLPTAATSVAGDAQDFSSRCDILVLKPPS